MDYAANRNELFAKPVDKLLQLGNELLVSDGKLIHCFKFFESKNNLIAHIYTGVQSL